ncbi:MAG TPA: ABC transporter permease [Burkholderiaceae bacterium]|nr:ABC transporter permease [Burkholderiaceae bacterium]
MALWAFGAARLSTVPEIAEAFSPQASARALWTLIGDGTLWPHMQTSLQRIGVSLALALAIGAPLGVLVGMSRRFNQATGTLFQFLRMVSPLSWMPLAVMFLGIGDAPVIFLLSFAMVWPIMLNTAAGVAALDPLWLRLAESLSATRRETIVQVVLPGIVAHLLTGFRLAIGIGWIILVPAEMLGVSSGLGYFILDARDRLGYSDLMAAIVVIGALGFALDALARAAHRRWLHQSFD